MLAKINEEIKNAMIHKDASKRDVLRAVKSSANLLAKEDHTGITDEHIVAAVKKEIKTLNGTLQALEGKNGVAEAVADAKYRISVLEEYMPKMMSEAEVEVTVARIISGLENPNMGTAMKVVMHELKGKADGKVISATVSRVLKGA